MCPASIDAFMLATLAAWTPMMVISGLSDLSAQATPEVIPPPPIGITTTSRLGTCSSSSSPIVPWPAMM